MYTFLIVIGVLAALLLIVVIFLQNPKSDAVGPTSGASARLLGAGRTADFFEKTTWVLIIVLFLVSLLSGLFLSTPSSSDSETPRPILPRSMTTMP